MSASHRSNGHPRGATHGRRDAHAPAETGRLRLRAAGRRARILAVSSGKGGVGKTTLAANLGLELARLGRRVLLLDGAVGRGNLALLFGQAPKRTLEDALADRCAVDQVVVALRERLWLVPAVAGGGRPGDLTAAERSRLLGEVARLAIEPDVLLIDTAVADTVGRDLAALADRTLLLTTHEPTALSDTLGALKAAPRGPAGSAPAVDVVVTMAPSQAHARDTHGRLGRLTERFLGFTPSLVAVVPRDDAVGEAIVRQEPLVTIYPYAPASRAIASFARALADSRGTDHATPHVSPLAVPVRR